MSRTTRCQRCLKRYRGQPNWNADYIAGLLIGYLCPDCQTTDEDLDAELNPITGQQYRDVRPTSANDTEKIVYSLINIYSTPEVMRHKASRLEAARDDHNAVVMVKLMRLIADDMESGELYA